MSTTKTNTTEKTDLLRRAKAAGVRGYNLMNITTLRKAVKDAESRQDDAKTAAPKPAPKSDRDAVDDNGAFIDRTKRAAAAKTELTAEKAWKQGGEKGDRPSTPNLDRIRYEHENPGAKRQRRSRSGGSTRVAPSVRWTHNGEPVTDSMNKLSTMAYFFTKDLGGKGSKRIGAADFRKVLAKLGVEDPEHTTFEVTLPNGITVGAVHNGTGPATRADKPTKRTPAKATPAKSTTKRTTAKAAPAKKSTTKKAAPAKRATKRTSAAA